jgi:hypothetical protein
MSDPSIFQQTAGLGSGLGLRLVEVHYKKSQVKRKVILSFLPTSTAVSMSTSVYNYVPHYPCPSLPNPCYSFNPPNKNLQKEKMNERQGSEEQGTQIFFFFLFFFFLSCLSVCLVLLLCVLLVLVLVDHQFWSTITSLLCCLALSYLAWSYGVLCFRITRLF